jgi:hypothetical protein
VLGFLCLWSRAPREAQHYETEIARYQEEQGDLQKKARGRNDVLPVRQRQEVEEVLWRVILVRVRSPR